ncbi:MAG: hypothetical protein KAR07_09995, partial [Spirochaetes bacterium]|nr:hypothetical protein [Spirochaetota bacterium]
IHAVMALDQLYNLRVYRMVPTTISYLRHSINHPEKFSLKPLQYQLFYPKMKHKGIKTVRGDICGSKYSGKFHQF